MAMKHLRPIKRRSNTAAACLLGFLALTLSAVVVKAQQQGVPPLDEQLNILYSDSGSVEVANEYLVYNTCHVSKTAQGGVGAVYDNLAFVPIDATVNFYKDDNCQDFAFGLVGHYQPFPGPARSIKWVGRDRDNVGVYFNTPLPLTSKEGFGDGDGDAGTGDLPPDSKDPTQVTDPKQQPSQQVPSTVVTPPTGPPQTPSGGDNSDDADQSSESSFLSFVGSVVGSAIVLSIGGTIVWMTVGRKIVKSKAGGRPDKGKGVLPSYARARGHRLSDDDDYDAAQGDEHIRLTASRIRENDEAFEIGDGDDIESNDGFDDNGNESFLQHRRSSPHSEGGASTSSYHDPTLSGDEDVADDDSNDTQPLN
ncbi:hypothetical protein DFQ27_000584 [Actinomortierella ambigua]|uniref:Mid2 domain-containing protein n=1 Tax=Actinomortierella ambigua TaxID=1343610 RepID=A0A9P6QH94_9FUNG|nr:hypothetical protein DFQ27_000584 [Actinomortierella ambigua]